MTRKTLDLTPLELACANAIAESDNDPTTMMFMHAAKLALEHNNSKIVIGDKVVFDPYLREGENLCGVLEKVVIGLPAPDRPYKPKIFSKNRPR